MKIENATLYDLVLRAMMPDKQRKRNPFPVPLSVRPILLGAQRFVLDKAMSAYLVDLSIAAFDANPARAPQIADGARRLARLPHAVTWIEYDNAAYQQRKLEAYPHIKGFWGEEPEEPSEELLRVRRRVGWLLLQDKETVFRVSVFSGLDDHVMCMPIMFAWSSDDENAPPWRGKAPPDLPHEKQASFAVGVPGYKTDRAILTTPWPDQRMTIDSDELKRATLLGCGSLLRVVWCLLATINDLPTTVGLVRPNKGYVACGRYYKFVDHHTINLHVPAHINLRTLAARAVVLVRRRAHQVRGHWRKDFRKPASAFCEHAWQASAEGMVCSLCKGHRIWIIEHQRGDASLGFVTHDYAVKRGEAA